MGSTGSLGGAGFLTTHWSVVLAAAESDSPEGREALAKLCRSYWRPLYAYVRRRGYPPADSEDLTQGFFARLLERHDVGGVSPGRGRFRSYLLAAMNHFLSDAWDRARARKRGGDRVVHLDPGIAESCWAISADSGLTPEAAFDRQWAMVLLEDVHRRLKQEYVNAGKGGLFDALRFSLAGDRDPGPYANLARELNLSEGAVKVAVHRLRRRFRTLLRERVAETVSTAAEVDDEWRYLRQVLSGG